MSAPNYLFYKRGEVRHGEQELVHYKRRFTIADIVLTEEFFVTRKDTFGRGKCFWLAINEVYYKQGCTERSLRFSSVQSLDRLGRRGNMRDDSAEILLQFFFFSAGSSCEQFWHGQGCPLFDVVHPVLSLPTTASSTLQGALKDGFGEAVVGCERG